MNEELRNPRETAGSLADQIMVCQQAPEHCLFNILFLHLKLPQNLKYLSHGSCLKNLFKTSDCLLLWMEGLCYLLMDDFSLCTSQDGREI